MEDQAFNDYISAAKIHGEASALGNDETANAAYEQVISALKVLRLSSDRGESALIRMLSAHDASVKCWAATHLLPLNEQLAISVLHDLSEDESSLIAFNAKMVLREWEAGRLVVL